MTPQQVEQWTRQIYKEIIEGHENEDSRVEIKSEWIEVGSAAERLAAHANASRGSSILWIIGIDEKKKQVTGALPRRKEEWLPQVEAFFDGYAPRLTVDVNVMIEESTVVALYFDTSHEAPYVVRNRKSGGGYPEYVVPWRDGTRLRAARRVEFLRLLLPKMDLATLLEEFQFNINVSKWTRKYTNNGLGCLFRDDAFNRTMRDGALLEAPAEIKNDIYDAYSQITRANQLVIGITTTSMAGSPAAHKENVAVTAFVALGEILQKAHDKLSDYLKGNHEAV